MGHATFSSATTKPLAVPRPRASDGIGDALRGAYDRDQRLPQDMTQLLSKLDCRIWH